MSSHLDINALYQFQVQKEENKKTFYEQIVKKIHFRIENYAKRHETMCVCEIPEFVIGVPLYNRMNCCKYVLDRLKAEGFKVQYVHPYNIIVNWAKDVIEPFVSINNVTQANINPHINPAAMSGSSPSGYSNSNQFVSDVLKSYNPGSVGNATMDYRPQNLVKKPVYHPSGKLFN